MIPDVDSDTAQVILAAVAVVGSALGVLFRALLLLAWVTVSGSDG